MLRIFGTLSISTGDAPALLKNAREKIRIAAEKIVLFIATSSFDIVV